MPVDNTQFYGIGKGGAQVFNTNGLANQFGQMLAKRQLERQAELKALADQQSKISTDGLRDPDRQDFFKQVDDWRNKSIAAMNERDPYKRAIAKADAQKAYLQAQDFVGRSKAQGLKDRDFQKFAMNDATRHQLTDDAITKGLNNVKLGINHPELVDYSALERRPNVEAFNKRRKEIEDSLIGNAVEQYKLGNIQNIGNTKQTPLTKYKEVKQADQALEYLNEATHNYDFANVLQHSYPQFYQGATTPEQVHEAHAQAALQLAKDNKLYKSTGISFLKNDKPDNFYAHYDYRLNNPTGGTMQTPAQTLIAGDPNVGIKGMQQGGLGTGEKFIGLAPLAQYGGKKPTIGIDENTGEHLFSFPQQIGAKDKAAIKFNEDLKKQYEKNRPGTIGKLFGKKDVPFEKSEEYKQLKPETTIKRPAQVYRVNPASPDYLAQIAEIAKEQNINLSQLNQIEGKKGNRGQIQQAVGGKKTATTPAGTPLKNKHKKAATDYGL